MIDSRGGGGRQVEPVEEVEVDEEADKELDSRGGGGGSGSGGESQSEEGGGGGKETFLLPTDRPESSCSHERQVLGHPSRCGALYRALPACYT